MSTNIRSLRQVLRMLLLLPGLCIATPINSTSHHSGFYTDKHDNLHIRNPTAHGRSAPYLPPFSHYLRDEALGEFRSALWRMDSEYFSYGEGKWKDANDWTNAVMGSHVSGGLLSLSESIPYNVASVLGGVYPYDNIQVQQVEYEVSKYFRHLLKYYSHEDIGSILYQANDDMLWVVLGWLDATRFTRQHSEKHYAPSQKYQGRQYETDFAYRAGRCYDQAHEGWDTTTCGGGMVWNLDKKPYKNAITNELFIAASVAMHLSYPGEREGEYLRNAVEGYKWLMQSGMKDNAGLYIDGFHERDGECNVPSLATWSYNQGVILSGSRGLWEAIGHTAYLEDGHELIRHVIRETGWNETQLSPTVSLSGQSLAAPMDDHVYKGRLGENGIMVESCDASATCSQDAQTFKGIFFHHLTAFCAPLPTQSVVPEYSYAADDRQAAAHRAACDEYAPWVVKNAQAAIRTKNIRQLFGTWWGAGPTIAGRSLPDAQAMDPRSNGTVVSSDADLGESLEGSAQAGAPKDKRESQGSYFSPRERFQDIHDRGRGRTVETQGGGVAVTRAMYEFLKNYNGLL